jgi:hypothetical protein
MDRIIKAVTFRKEVYAEVEQDESFTTSAWLIVVVAAALSALGGLKFEAFGLSLGGVVVGTIIAVIGFAIGALVINLVGRVLFKADVSFAELVRTLGLAYVWNAVGFLGIIGANFGALGCLVAPIQFVAWLASIVSSVLAVKEALDLDWGPTIVTVVLGWIVIIVFSVITGVILGAMGLVGAGIVGALRG